MAHQDFVIVGGLESDAFAELVARGTADMIWVDPPWGPGALSYFYTLNKNKASKLAWDEFLISFCGACLQMCPRGPIYVVMGNRWVDEMSARMSEFGIQEIDRQRVFYPTGKGPLPCTLWYGSTSLGEPLNTPEHIVGSSAKRQSLLRVVLWCIKRHPKVEIVLDLCCGKGQTAKAAVQENKTFWGLELNPDRAAVTAALLNKKSRSKT